MLTQDYVSWVVIGAIDSTTDQLLFAHVCFIRDNSQPDLFIVPIYTKKKQPHGLLFIYLTIG
ncbi:hypothetical protein YEP4_07907 [Yersinia enterocolitica subsp. palearctica YE-P4]|uniref:Uncharacterized protein n=1 Tax=Yersinia enterocolitica subsp. palearctica serotype O:3 (strain DSM 13030 / CIP 106945 / Y11) TaxID=930944 RepID=A0A0H3NN64_YERE1|nr:hypothetical protein [Yersinia enterocolitica]EOR68338.1 hypothetical protein YE149_07984 [Yersinia enterocolitica subsp. palearctica YE-149]EOR77500.1 hypothetical protein YE150_07935 [Yersinia enterocolitica subsp. palearctica YE-150]EOR77686.1 hypothetical protein YEP1_07995 [Yersinia enterocolitica subsp. palearctica YE-P1]EOR82180.1 hypothetical protein YEP4_07907 [Yersinia enterocolitica subsp. palearctica YE-P4]OAM68888.1 hypothetical protein A8L35_07800 [Yersinia enterocolitica subs